jgi:hypothetical protein
VAEERKGEKKRGPKGGIKHTPGRGHSRKSSPHRKLRFGKRAARLRKEKEETARKLWKEWDDLTPELPRPKNEN